MLTQVDAILVRGSSPLSSTYNGRSGQYFDWTAICVNAWVINRLRPRPCALGHYGLYGDEWMRDPRLVLAMLDGIDDYVFGAYL